MTIVLYKGLSVSDLALQPDIDALVDNNMRELADRVGPVAALAVDPVANDDDSNTSGNGTFYKWSKWHNTSTDKWFVCLDPSTGASDWKEVLSVFNRAFYEVSDAVGVQGIISTDTIVNLDTINRANAAFYTLATDEIQFLVAGEYRITIFGSIRRVNTNGGPRSTVLYRMQEDSAGYADITQSRCTIYIREQVDSGGSCTRTFYATVAALDKMRLIAVRRSGTTVCETVPGEQSVLIEKVG